MLDLHQLYADLQRDEGLRLLAYRCPAGVLTIGYGHTAQVHAGQICTAVQAEEWLRGDVANVLCDLDHALKDPGADAPWWRRLSEPRQRALVNMAFNLGLPHLLGFKRMLAALKDGNFATAAAETLDSDWARQVGQRANRIAALIRQG